jgi:predicted Zn-dependent protease with MMP-like domain
MSESIDAKSFDEIVQWAYSTLPQKIRELPDFPGIQVLDEPPKGVLKEISQRRNWPKGAEMRGLYSGVHRTERQHTQSRIAPDLIFVFRGPILRSSRGNLRAEVKQTVWHEVAHWLGHNEEEVRDLGLSSSKPQVEEATHEVSKNYTTGLLAPQTPEEKVHEEEVDQRARCIKCYSADVICHEIEMPLSYARPNPLDPIIVHTVHAKGWTCNSCGKQWEDDDEA